jgi:hypothetical protein
MIAALSTLAAHAGPMIQPTPEGVQGGIDGAWYLGLCIAAVVTPLLAWLLTSQIRLLLGARRAADEHRKLP